MYIHVISLILLAIARVIATDVGFKHKVVTDIVNSYNTPTSVLLHGCHQKQFELSLAKELNQAKKFKSIQDVKTIRRRDLVHNAKNLLFVVDLSCPGVRKFLKQSAALKLFSAPYRWLLLVSLDEPLDVTTVLAGLFFPADSEAVLVRETDDNHYKINLIYKINASDEWRLELYGYWNLTHGLQKPSLTGVAAARRRNLHGHQIGVGWVVTDNATLYKYIDKQDPKIDRVTKVNMVTGGFLIDFVNASRKYIITETWGFQSNNSWNGLTGYLERGEIDIGGTPMFIVPERLLFLQYIARPTKDGTAFVFQQPPLSYTSNIFLLSFQDNLWYGSLVFLCILFFILYMMTFWEWKKMDTKSSNDDKKDILRLNLSDVGLVIVGATCQQGSPVELKGPSGRMVLLLLFAAVMFLYTSFCANIVALLQSSSSQIKTLQDLLNSNLKFGIEEYKWIQSYFELFSSWYSGKNRSLKFGKPMIWREPTNHVTDCYFCLTKTFGFNSKNKDSIKYADVPSVTKPVLHSEDLPVPTSPGRSDQTHIHTTSSIIMHEHSNSEQSSSDNFFDDKDSPHLITQSELNDLIRDLQLPKSKAELLSFRLQQWKLLDPNTKMEREPVRKALYEKKIAPHGDIQHFLSLERGVQEIKKGQFAFLMQLGVGYRAVARYLEEHEKCNLEEIAYLRVVDPYIAVRKGSPFLEMYNIGYKRLQEHGLQTRENLLMYTKKPKCSGRQANFVSVSLIDCSPAFVVLASGVVIAALLCVFENVYNKVKTEHSHEIYRN